jgi:hypothetical protein
MHGEPPRASKLTGPTFFLHVQARYHKVRLRLDLKYLNPVTDTTEV